MDEDRVDYPYPTRRISLGLSDGGEMQVSIPGRPDEPVDEQTLEALRSIGEAAIARMMKATSSTDGMNPCPDKQPHDRHEWIDGVLRRDCPGVPAAESPNLGTHPF